MGLNSTPSSDRVHIGIFGRRNAGKSSVINGITGQNLAIVSDVKGTTTDPVYKAMELLPVGPVMMIDTPGLDDEGELGLLRIKKGYQVLNKTDVAVLVVDVELGITSLEEELISRFKDKEIPYIVVMNKADKLTEESRIELEKNCEENVIYVSTINKYHIWELKELIASRAVEEEKKIKLVGDIINPSDYIILVVPIDKAAPKGRLILPQQQTIRDIIDSNARAIVIKEDQLVDTLESLGVKPKLVITDSQVFDRVSKDTPRDIPLTSFSILFARYKGALGALVNGVQALNNLKDGDTVLISEGCTHHKQCDDIGEYKIPNWIQNKTKKTLKFEHTSGVEFPDDLSKYALIVHCGGCMLNEREMKYRIKCAKDQGIPITNYGVLIAYMQGILTRTIEPFELL